MTKYLKLIIVIALTFMAINLLFAFGSKPLFHFAFFKSGFINTQINLQLSTILVSSTLCLMLGLIATKTRFRFLNLKHIDAPMLPVKLLGIPQGSRWKSTGFLIAALISLGTGVAVYMQVSNRPLSLALFPDVPLILILSLMNSFTEEVVFRLSYVTIVDDQGFSPKLALFLGSAVFGVVHYFGMAPKGLIGALMAGFLGWFLTKSILETKGFFWAWFIHFLQDVVILTLFFSAF